VGLILRPGHEDWIRDLVACDPLYLVDTHDELLEPARLKFNDQYQRRLRTYTIKETNNPGILNQLPEGQFGFCLVYNFFNYKPIEIIELYLSELYAKLKPGGVIAFTFNDCDRAEGIELFERHFMSYTPGNNIIALCQTIGYEIKNIFRLDHSCTWIEIARPGNATSIKGGQSLAKVLYKDEYYHYTKEQIEIIKQQAHDLNIAKSEELDNMPIGRIVELINQRNSK
jgi:SAM-dependent methyltransferase